MTIVLLIDAVVAGTRGSSHPRWWGVALGAMIFVASTVRTIGLLFVPTLIVTHAILLLRLSQPTASKERFLPVAIIPYAVLGLLILTLILVLPIGEGSHVEHLISLTPRVLLRNTAAYVAMPAAFFQSLPYPGALHGVLLPFALSGAVLRGRTEFHVLAYLALTFGMLVTWPDRQGIRFLFPDRRH